MGKVHSSLACAAKQEEGQDGSCKEETSKKKGDDRTVSSMLSPSFGQCYDSSRWQASNESCANRRPLRRDPDEIKDSDSCRHRMLVDCFFEIGYTACALE
ncbi:hypothetical protein RO3G_12119 [Rhizopus delemar RA 99-880]|uniref:Uncharacterized protein n=1 Tax=Rhizopus delemar (strain RA 99-880 / ATCC MYA-4621 / FGSC 9543 / NRRL 43880) TaxID=246409 RepID=I1CG28_RHIO9|nr:hypothetical protein RO3G_12119 [Rhizopus delemar RA 99-880]|eukprot:EIE87408.1 hypothetical protein RO3G_12119 [Rhizopus delemar RA 99-880]